jgi:hypothetical protein
MTTGWPKQASELLGRSVRVGKVEVGTVTSVLASLELGYVFGLEVRGRDGHDHFVPWVAGDVAEGSVELRSAFSLLSSSELALYVENGVRVAQAGDSILVSEDGRIVDGAGRPVTRATSSVHAPANRSIP